MKKLVTFVLAAVMALGIFAGCTPKTKSDSDLDYVKNKGKLVVGITEFEPMDFQKSGSSEWVGFDADMAKEFAKELGVEVEFVVITWDEKINELNTKNIDCVWNGMTLGDEVKAGMECSKAYCNNQQVVVVKADVADKYTTKEACKELKFAVEDGSAGKAAAEKNGYQFTAVTDQATALMEVKSGTSDAAIIDSLMAGAMIGEGTAYANLKYTVALGDEEYGVGFRKGSDLAAKLNDFFKKTYDNGKMLEIAKTYGTQEALIAQ